VLVAVALTAMVERGAESQCLEVHQIAPVELVQEVDLDNHSRHKRVAPRCPVNRFLKHSFNHSSEWEEVPVASD